MSDTAVTAAAGRAPLASGPLSLHPDGCYATLHGRPIRDLTRSEFDVLYVLASRPGRVCGIQRLIDATEGRRVSRMPILIQGVRRKLGDDRRRLIVSVWGRGYAYVPPRAASLTGTQPGCRLTTDGERILRILADGGPTPTGRIALLVNPFPSGGSRDDYERMREIRARGRRDRELVDAVVRLVDRGLVEGPWDARRITGAGREELARADAEGGDAP